VSGIDTVHRSGIDTVHRSCWGFWARRARIVVDILGLGSYLVGREDGFG
jgi:hypothetical protein